MRLPADLKGHRFGRLVIQDKTRSDEKSNSWWLCLCDCGLTKELPRYNLVTGNTKSCGCLSIEKTIALDKARTKHGHRVRVGNKNYTKIYSTWVSMIQRCLNPRASNYKFYGARGISVSDSWRKFENFYADMGDSPPKLSLDRINNDGNYEHGNCRWATAKQQRANQRPRQC